MILKNKVKLKTNSQDTSGKKLSSDHEYTLVLDGRFYSIIEDKNNIQYYINNKYIKKLPRV